MLRALCFLPSYPLLVASFYQMRHIYVSSADSTSWLYEAIMALFSSKIFCKIDTVTFSFVFDKYCPITD